MDCTETMDSNLNKTEVPNTPLDLKRIGFWLSEKKIRELKFIEFSQYCRNHSLELVKINFKEPLEKQGPFSAIIHKLSDIIIRGDQGNKAEKEMGRRFEEYAATHPEMAVIDPIPNVRQLLDRNRQYKIIQECNMGSTVFTPPFVELTTSNIEENLHKLKLHNVEFPVVCKPSVAHGSTFAHQMSLIFGPRGLADVRPPCVAQAFVCHGAVLYKIFIVGQKYHVIERPSLKNFKAGDKDTIFFDSHDISKTTSTSWLIKLDESDMDVRPLEPDLKQLEHIASLMQRRLGLDLFGIDVIMDQSNGNYAIIDINTFPGYKGFPHLWEELSQLIQSRIAPPKACIMTPPGSSCATCQSVGLYIQGPTNHQLPCLCCPSDAACDGLRNRKSQQESAEPGVTKDSANSTEDSGIDTSDSCDERKHCPVTKNVKRQHAKSTSAPSTMPSGSEKMVCH